MANSEAHTLAAIRECRDHIVATCETFAEDDWRKPTACPGWDVQDVVAHLGSLESYLLGKPATDLERAVDRPWVRNALGALNETLVEARRGWPPSRVLDELRSASGERLAALEATDEAGLDELVAAPRGGTMPLRQFLGVRLWDFAVHEADIAEATGRPLRLDSPAARRIFTELALLSGRALGRARAPEGAALRISLEGTPHAYTARVDGGRGAPSPVAAEEATLHLRASPTAFLRVATGRRDPAEAIRDGDVAVLAGDAGAAAAVLGQFNVVP
ncbi:MAG: maleylpyruvate isomerase family mycothiol-dependent enzyme [Candidatus Dormibacteria bacterium]